jgi:hypothetical protein
MEDGKWKSGGRQNYELRMQNAELRMEEGRWKMEEKREG